MPFDIKLNQLDPMRNLAIKQTALVFSLQHRDGHTVAPAHVHDHPQLWFCKKGEYLHSINGKTLLYGEGSFLIVPAGSMHSFMTLSDSKTELFEMIFQDGAFDGLSEKLRHTAFYHLYVRALNDDPPPVFNFTGDDKVALTGILSELVSLSEKDLPSSKPRAAELLSELFSFPQFEISRETLAASKKFYNERLLPLMRGIDFINQNFSLRIRQKDVLNASLLPRNVFQTLFKKFTGVNLATYVSWLRIHRAQYFIGYSEYSFEYIADICGFCNIQYMNKLFKECFGTTPYLPRMKYKRNVARQPDKKIGKNFADSILSEKEKMPI